MPPQMVILAEDRLHYYVQVLSKMDWTAELEVVQTLPLSLELHLAPHKKDSVCDPCLIHGCDPWPITTKSKIERFFNLYITFCT